MNCLNDAKVINKIDMGRIIPPFFRFFSQKLKFILVAHQQAVVFAQLTGVIGALKLPFGVMVM